MIFSAHSLSLGLQGSEWSPTTVQGILAHGPDCCPQRPALGSPCFDFRVRKAQECVKQKEPLGPGSWWLNSKASYLLAGDWGRCSAP